MSKLVSRIIISLLLILFFALALHSAGIVICPDHGVRSAFTGNKKIVYNGSKRHDYCEYTHPLKDLSNSHKFWSDCE